MFLLKKILNNFVVESGNAAIIIEILTRYFIFKFVSLALMKTATIFSYLYGVIQYNYC